MDIKCSKKIQSDDIMKITVGIPAYNEEKNIAKIISQIKEITPSIIVCDDYSTDDTNQIANSLGVNVITVCVVIINSLLYIINCKILNIMNYVNTSKYNHN